jgi:hypothetical protein
MLTLQQRSTATLRLGQAGGSPAASQLASPPLPLPLYESNMDVAASGPTPGSSSHAAQPAATGNAAALDILMEG